MCRKGSTYEGRLSELKVVSVELFTGFGNSIIINRALWTWQHITPELRAELQRQCCQHVSWEPWFQWGERELELKLHRTKVILYFWVQDLFIAQADLNLQQFSCLSFPRIGITGMSVPTWLKFKHLILKYMSSKKLNFTLGSQQIQRTSSCTLRTSFQQGHPTRRPNLHTWKWGLETHLANCRKRGSMIFTNSDGSITSKISSNSFKNITSFGLWVFGQYLRSAITTYKTTTANQVMPIPQRKMSVLP